MTFYFTIPGVPIPKGRPRVMRGGWAFTPKRTEIAQNSIRLVATRARQATKSTILGPNYSGRLLCHLKFFGARENADLDNLYKTVTDACEGVLYKNDCQIDDAAMVRLPAKKSDARTEVAIEEIKGAL